MTRDPMTDLDALLAAARAAEPAPLDPAFAARLAAQAEAARPRPAPRPGWRARLAAALAEFGGAPGLAGLTAAGVAGLWIGLADPVGAAALILPGGTDAATPFDLFADL